MCELRKRMEQKLDAMMEDCQEAQRQGKDREAQFGFKWCAWLRETLEEEKAMHQDRAGNQFARVIRFEDGTYLGQASTKVGSYLNAKLFTGSEARDKMKSYQEGEVSVHLLEDLRPGD